jgi:transcriptional regulator with XRE-family HTH domain
MTKADALKAWRERHDLTQEQAAHLAGASLSGWRCWERGTTSGPSIDVLRRLEKAHPGVVAAVMAAEPEGP